MITVVYKFVCLYSIKQHVRKQLFNAINNFVFIIFCMSLQGWMIIQPDIIQAKLMCLASCFWDGGGGRAAH